jgi:chromosome segregation ATPase
MTAEINALFEEGITRSRELSDEADEAMKAVDRMAKDAETLTQKVEAEGQEACQQLRQLAQRLAQAEAEVEASRSQAEGALGGLDGAAEDLKGGIGDLLERVRKSLFALESRRDEIDHSLDAQMAATQEGFEELVDKAGEAQSIAGQELDQVAQAVAALRSAIGDAREHFAQKQQAWSDAADGMEQAIHEQLDAWMAGLSELLTRQAQAMVDAANSMVDQHNGAMDGLRRRFIEEGPQELATALEPLESALEQLGVEAAERQTRLSAAAEDHERWAGNARTVVDQVRDALNAAGRLG